MKTMKRLLKHLERKVHAPLYREHESQRMAVGRVLSNQVRGLEKPRLSEMEFRIYSQWGMDGILQYLTGTMPLKNKVFVEFGVEDYREANTRFLLVNDNWSGLVMDGDEENIRAIERSRVYWKYDLTAKRCFVTRDNIDDILLNYVEENGFGRDIGVLGIDIDGNDYYILDSIKSLTPIILICEYNWIFGSTRRVSIPYDPGFQRRKAHYSNLYWGASIQALFAKAAEKGYRYVGCTSGGNDAAFVRSDYADKYLPHLITTPKECFHELKTKEARDRKGNLTFADRRSRREIIKDMEVFDVESGEKIKLEEVFRTDHPTLKEE